MNDKKIFNDTFSDFTKVILNNNQNALLVHNILCDWHDHRITPKQAYNKIVSLNNKSVKGIEYIKKMAKEHNLG